MHSIDVLRSVLRYEPDTGKLFWLPRTESLCKSKGEMIRWNGRYAGKEAFTPNTDGYIDGFIFRKMHRAHRVAWALYYGEFPNGQIDHINGVRTDNRISNLRIVTAQENSRNSAMKSTNTSGSIGVSRHKSVWRATIHVNGRQKHLGLFNDIEDAVSARKAAEIVYGYHHNHGRRI